jgi:hypothetical protein
VLRLAVGHVTVVDGQRKVGVAGRRIGAALAADPPSPGYRRLGRHSEAGFFAEVARDWAHLFPVLLHQSEANRGIRWLWGARSSTSAPAWLRACRPMTASRLIPPRCRSSTHPSRIRGPDGGTGPNGLHARFGRDAAHAEGFYGSRLAIKTDLGSRIVRAWSIVAAAVNEREVPLTCWRPGRRQARGRGADDACSRRDCGHRITESGKRRSRS